MTSQYLRAAIEAISHTAYAEARQQLLLYIFFEDTQDFEILIKFVRLSEHLGYPKEKIDACIKELHWHKEHWPQEKSVFRGETWLDTVANIMHEVLDDVETARQIDDFILTDEYRDGQEVLRLVKRYMLEGEQRSATLLLAEVERYGRMNSTDRKYVKQARHLLEQ